MGRRVCRCAESVDWSLHTGEVARPTARRWCPDCRKLRDVVDRRWIDRRSGAGEWDGEADDAVRAWEDGRG